MEEKTFVWTSALNKRLILLRIEHDCLFKKKKQPWSEFRKILIENGFPEEMTLSHVRKKWCYMYDTYKHAKKRNNTNIKYFKLFERLYGRTTILDKYESWNDDWRLIFVNSMYKAKEKDLDYRNTWKSLEEMLRAEELPIDCCIQDIKGLWQHIRMTFNRKHRLKLKKGKEITGWILYEPMIRYFQKFEPDYLLKFDTESSNYYIGRQRKSSNNYLNKSNENKGGKAVEFQWSKDITESFIQIRLQNDWLFRERKWAWNDLLAIMREEYGFPNSLTGRDISRKWSSTFREFQKAKATNNTSWVYLKLFDLYLGEGSLSLNPTIHWKEEWIFNLISARGDFEHHFTSNLRDHINGWREIEKKLRRLGLPSDHCLLDLPEVWADLLKTYRWKRKFADKGILSEQWPYYNAMLEYTELHTKKNEMIKQTPESESTQDDHYDDCCRVSDDEEDGMKSKDLKQKIHIVSPKIEIVDGNQCRTCSTECGKINIFTDTDEDGVHLAEKLKVIGGVEVDESDVNLPYWICLNCAGELDAAYRFRMKCQEFDKKFRSGEIAYKIKAEDHVDECKESSINDDEKSTFDPGDSQYEDQMSDSEPKPEKLTVKEERAIIRKKKVRKLKYDYWKVCEVCGKYTKNLVSHLDTHSSSKEHACGVCGKKFKFRSGLLIHKAVHDATPKKTCEVCGKTFHVMAQYRKHFVYHANERKFECETCGKRFNTMDILRVHNRIHTDERPFSCDDCGKSFRTAGCVSRHKRIVHRNVKVN